MRARDENPSRQKLNLHCPPRNDTPPVLHLKSLSFSHRQLARFQRVSKHARAGSDARSSGLSRKYGDNPSAARSQYRVIVFAGRGNSRGLSATIANVRWMLWAGGAKRKKTKKWRERTSERASERRNDTAKYRRNFCCLAGATVLSVAGGLSVPVCAPVCSSYKYECGFSAGTENRRCGLVP